MAPICYTCSTSVLQSDTIIESIHCKCFMIQAGGYVVGYENLTFVTVRGAGHLVPRYQPARGLAIFSSFLEGKLPPSS
ncbi:unnamed protein product [Coffea canephora]|uniref:DH200=94 genomic scaffold, scaffold_5072 n=1 Tax=Coffea canephora TaxID=49390 RepID=A0A068VLK6_COFCA|nr:unnamed protein product [Coffea canephora]